MKIRAIASAFVACALVLAGCTSITQKGKDGIGVSEISVFTKSTIASGSSELKEGGASKISVKGLDNDPTAVYSLLNTLLQGLIASQAAATAAQVDAAQARAQLQQMNVVQPAAPPVR